METGSGCFLSFGALTRQIRTVEGKRKNLDSLRETEAFHQATVCVLVAKVRYFAGTAEREGLVGL